MSVKKLAGQTAIYGISSIAGRAINWGLTPLFTHFFLTGEYGVYSDLIAMVFYALVFLTFGMETSFFHFVNKSRDPQKVYSNALLWVGTLSLSFLAVALLLHQPLADLLGYGERPELVVMALLIVVLDALVALPMARLRHEQRATRFAFISFMNIGVSVVLNVVFILLIEADVKYIFLANVIASGIKLMLALDGALPKYWRFDKKTIRALRQYGFFIMLAGLLGALNEMLDRNLLPRLWPDGKVWDGLPRSGMEMNGIYSANYKLAILITLATQAYRYAAEPFFFRDSGQKKSKENMARVFHYFMLASLFTLLMVGSFAWELVSFDGFGLFGGTLIAPAYWSGLVVVPILLAANVFLGAYINLSMWYKISGQLRFGLLIALVGALITIVINVLTIPWLGFVGSALATLLCYAAMSMLCYWLGQRHYAVPYRINKLLVYGVFAAGLASFNLWLSLNGYTGAAYFGLKVVLCGVLVGAVWLNERRASRAARYR